MVKNTWLFCRLLLGFREFFKNTGNRETFFVCIPVLILFRGINENFLRTFTVSKMVSKTKKTH